MKNFPIRSHRAFVFLTAVLLLLRAADSRAQSKFAPASPPSPAGLEDYTRRYQADAISVSRFYDLSWSEARFDRLGQFYRDESARLKQVDFDALDQPGRVDYLLLRNKLAEETAHLALDQKRLAEMTALLPFRQSLQELEETRRQMKPVNSQADAGKIAAIPDEIKKLRARIEKGRAARKPDQTNFVIEAGKPETSDQDIKKENDSPLKVSPVVAKRAADALDSLRGEIKSWFVFYDGFQPEFSWWVKKPYEDTARAMEDYAKYLREDIAGLKGKDEDPLIGDPIGAEGLADDLAAENLPYTPDELITIANREFAWCEGEMKKASAEMGFGDDWKAALARVKSDYVPPGAQDELVATLAREAIRFVKDHELVTIPPLCDETWRLTMSSPETQKTLPFAAYGGQSMTVAYANEEMKNDDKLMSMRGNNRHFTRIVVPHELIPGHHLQGFVAERNRAYRSLFRTPFLVEGWALYWETRLWDLNYAQSPGDRVGMLFWRMHRCARIIVSLKFHLGQMTPAEMIDFLVDRVGHERSGATGEVRRFIGGAYSPLYQCAYMIGGLQLRALHNEAVKPGGMTEKQFNDTVLTCNAIPIELIRDGMLNVPLTRGTKPNWDFAGLRPK